MWRGEERFEIGDWRSGIGFVGVVDVVDAVDGGLAPRCVWGMFGARRVMGE